MSVLKANLKKLESKFKTLSKKSKPFGRLVIISAPSGGGKTTIVSRLLAKKTHFKRSISYTTRQPRKGERHGRDYNFVTKADFLRRRRQGFFLEWANVFGQYYGTARTTCLKLMRAGFDVILAIDVQGMRKIKRLSGKSMPMVSVFLMPPSMAVLKKRLLGRQSDSAAEIKKRLQTARAELTCRRFYDYVVINNTIQQCVKDVSKILGVSPE